MIFKAITPDTYITSDWAGGKTTQIAIDPPEALYAGGQLDRVFSIRSPRSPDGSYYFLPPER